jgi:hypothetical protein
MKYLLLIVLFAAFTLPPRQDAMIIFEMQKCNAHWLNKHTKMWEDMKSYMSGGTDTVLYYKENIRRLCQLTRNGMFYQPCRDASNELYLTFIEGNKKRVERIIIPYRTNQ